MPRTKQSLNATQTRSYFLRILLSSYAKIGMLLVVGGSFFFSCMILVSQFRTNDKLPEVSLIDMEMRKSIRDFSAVVNTGMYIKNFEEFDVITDRFVVNALVWFEFNTDEIMPELIEKFTFLNGVIVEKSQGDVRINDRRMFIKYDVRATFKNQLSYYKYPLDDHRLSLVLTNNYLTPEECYFVLENSYFGVANDAFADHWKVHSTETSWGYNDLNLHQIDNSKNLQRPIAVYTINFFKSGLRRSVIIFFPLLSALFLSFLCFFVLLSQVGTRIRLSTTALTAFLGYRFVIDRMMPNVGYFTLVDLIYSLFLVVIVTIFIMQLLISRYEDQLKEEAYASVFDYVDCATYYGLGCMLSVLIPYFVLS